MSNIKVALFAPDAYKMPKNLKRELNTTYGNKVELEFLFHWEPPTVEEMRATGVCDELDEACWKAEDKNFYCSAQITTLMEKLVDYEYFLFLTTHNPLIRASLYGVQTLSSVGRMEGKHLAIAPFWDMSHILHEVGHLLGLKHCRDKACVMYEGYLCKQRNLCKNHKKEIGIYE
jgi:hypothetical protein